MEMEVVQHVSPENFPRYMEKGSQGPAVNVLLISLAAWARFYRSISGREHLPSAIVPDCRLGDVGVAWLKIFQEACGTQPDGGFGPVTRIYFDTFFGFGFEAAARATGGTTVFVQPNQDMLAWSPEEAS
jgi:hypothetical protein